MVINGQALLQAAPIANMAHKKNRTHGTSWGLSEAGYDIRIAEDIHFSAYSIHTHSVTHYDENEKPRRFDVNQPGFFVLASTIELFHMPSDLVGIVHDKSTNVRSGLTIFNTVIEPGWKGILTLEMVYHGQEPFDLLRGQGIGQVIFHKLSQEASYDGKYQHQGAGPQAARYD